MFGIGEPARAQLFRALLNGSVRRVDKPWGREFIISTDDFLLKVIEVFAGQRTSLQHHNEKTEIHWLLEGTGELYKRELDPDELIRYETEAEMRPSPGLLVHPGEVHRAIGPLLILEISTNHPDDVVRHEDDYSREDPSAR
jgi:mannose-6-phosphate isomerase-like protein (cupin superfamily)